MISADPLSRRRRTRLWSEDEEMDDPAVTSALAAAARRGVDVEVIMTADPEWDAAFTELDEAGAHVPRLCRAHQNDG
jgi:hypothetical protein